MECGGSEPYSSSTRFDARLERQHDLRRGGAGPPGFASHGAAPAAAEMPRTTHAFGATINFGDFQAYMVARGQSATVTPAKKKHHGQRQGNWLAGSPADAAAPVPAPSLAAGTATAATAASTHTSTDDGWTPVANKSQHTAAITTPMEDLKAQQAANLSNNRATP